MVFSKQLLFLFLVSLSIFACVYFHLSSTGNEVASSSKNNDCHKLKSTVSALHSIIKEKNQELLTLEEKIRGLELYIRKNSNLFDSDKYFSQSENPVKHASEGEEKDFELEKQIDGKWFLSKLGLNPNQIQAYLLTLWHQHLSPTLQKNWIPTIRNTSVTLTTYLKPKFQYLIDKSIKSLARDLIQRFDVSRYYPENWIPSIRNASVTLTTYLKQTFQYLIDKSIKSLAQDLIQGFDVSCYYPEVNRIMTVAKLHLEKVQVYLRVMYRKLKAWLQEGG